MGASRVSHRTIGCGPAKVRRSHWREQKHLEGSEAFGWAQATSAPCTGDKADVVTKRYVMCQRMQRKSQSRARYGSREDVRTVTEHHCRLRDTACECSPRQQKRREFLLMNRNSSNPRGPEYSKELVAPSQALALLYLQSRWL